KAAPVSSTDILAAERSIIAARFRGSRSGYLSAIAQAHTSLSVARGVIGDELRHGRIESRFRVSAPSGREIADYQDSYGDLSARLMSAQRAALSEATCWRDQMPEPSEVDLTNYLPFLALTG